MMFTKIFVKNFKAVGPASLEIDLKPLTILVGKNGSGKSCVLEALALTAQSATEDPNRNELILSGSKVDLLSSESRDYRSKCKDIYFKKDLKNVLEIGFETSVNENQLLSLPAKLQTAVESKIAKKLMQWPPVSIGYRWSRADEYWPVWSHEYSLDTAKFLRIWMEVVEAGESGATIKKWVNIRGEGNENWSGSCERVLLKNIQAGLTEKSQNDVFSVALSRLVETSGKILFAALEDVQFLSCLRGTGLMLSDVGPKVAFVGKHAENTIRLLSNIQNRTETRFEPLKKWAGEFGLPGVTSGWFEENKLMVGFLDPITGTSLDINQAATGSRQGLIMAAQLIFTKPGSTLLIEEPENNLHPAYEKLLPELFADSIKTGHQIIASTHSEVLVAALGNAVRQGTLSKSDIAVFHLERSSDGVRAEKINISDRGYLDGWVKSFAEVEQELFNEWFEKLPEERQKSSGGHPLARTSGKGRERRKGG